MSPGQLPRRPAVECRSTTHSSAPGVSSRRASDSLVSERDVEANAKTLGWTIQSADSLEGTNSNTTSAKRTNRSWTHVASKVGTCIFERIIPGVGEHFASTGFGERPSESKNYPWKPTIVRLGPVSGICGMLLAFASIVASLGVLVGSDGSPVQHWSAPPSTYLAIYTAIANLAMRYACIQGVLIAWWCKALRGSSFKQLHYDYRAGTTLGGALTSGRYTGILGVACIAATLVVVDGPLLQRASTVKSASVDQPIPLNVTMAAQVPTEYTGWWQTVQHIDTGYNYSNAFNATMPAPHGRVSNQVYNTILQDMQTKLTKAWFFQKAPLTGVFQGCSGQCTAKLIAPALAATSCSSRQLQINRNEPLPADLSDTIVPALRDDAFVISVDLVVDGAQEKINLVTAYADNLENCRGVLNVTACTLESAVGEYTVSIDNDIATVDPSSAISPRILALSKNAAVNREGVNAFGLHHSTLAGLVALHWAKWDGYSAVWKEGGTPYAWVVDPGAVFTYEHRDKPGQCASFSDPTADMLLELNMLMVYTGMFAARESVASLKARMEPQWADSIRTTITGQEVGKQSVFNTNFHYFAAAAVLELVCIVLIAPTYWGWWKLGRHVSFSPLEVAKAFGSPLLSEYNSNATGRDVASLTGDSHIQYGAAKDIGGEKTRLTFADTNSVELPRKGELFDA